MGMIRTRQIRTAVALSCVVLVGGGLMGCSNDKSSDATGQSGTAASTSGAPSTSTPSSSSTSSTSTVPSTSTSTTMQPITTIPSTERPHTVADLLNMDRPIVLAHTGGEDAYPGSTMFAFAQSAKDGADVLDLNIILSADGVLMVQHDDNVDRTTNSTGAVASMTAEQLQALDNAYWFTPDCGVCTDQPAEAYIYRGIRTGEKPPPAGYTPDDFAMPTLRAVIERFPDYPLNIEIKGNGDPARAAADALAKELTELKRLDASVVTSFDDEIVTYFHGLLPEVEMSPGLGATTGWVLNAAPLPEGMRILQLPPEYQGTVVITPELITESSAAGYPIWIWPNNRKLENQETYLSYLDMGIVGLNINFPAQGTAAVEQFVLSGESDVVDTAVGTSASS